MSDGNTWCWVLGGLCQSDDEFPANKTHVWVTSARFFFCLGSMFARQIIYKHIGPSTASEIAPLKTNKLTNELNISQPRQLPNKKPTKPILTQGNLWSPGNVFHSTHTHDLSTRQRIRLQVLNAIAGPSPQFELPLFRGFNKEFFRHLQELAQHKSQSKTGLQEIVKQQ